MPETMNSGLASAALDRLCAADFQPYTGTDFCIRFSEDVAVTAQLENVLELCGYSGLERQPFSIVFQTDQQRSYYTQAIYRVEHPALGVLPIFLVPLGIKGKGMQYEAVFS
jgi:hypothetical protein